MRLLVNRTTWRYFLYCKNTGKFKTISRSGANALRDICEVELEMYYGEEFKLKRKEILNG